MEKGVTVLTIAFTLRPCDLAGLYFIEDEIAAGLSAIRTKVDHSFPQSVQPRCLVPNYYLFNVQDHFTLHTPTRAVVLFQVCS